MMRSGLRFSNVTILLLASMFVTPQLAYSSDKTVLGEALAKQPFVNLPGVNLPQKMDDEPQTACTSSIERRSYRGRSRNGLGERVYRCNVDNAIIESTGQPDEIDWKKQKRYYKPWIDDGFDR